MDINDLFFKNGFEAGKMESMNEITRLTDECAQLRQGYTAVRDDMAKQIKEFKQLSDEAIHNEGVMVALKEGYLERGLKIEELEDEILEMGEHDV